MQVLVNGKEEKRGMTACVTTTMAGGVLPLQVIYGGKTELCRPQGQAAEEAARLGFHVTSTDSHWSTQASMADWFEKASPPSLLP